MVFADFVASAGFFVGAFTALFTITNPFSTASIFLTITQNDSHKKRKLIAKKACLAAAIVLTVFALAGTFILDFFSVTVDAFRIAGGILIARVGFGMLHSDRPFKNDMHKEEAIAKDDISIIPLAIPMLSGPGALTTAIVLMGETGGWIGGWMNIVATLLAIIVVSFVSYHVLKQSISMQKFIGHNERAVIDKIMGLIVLVVGIQFLINGIVGVVSGIML